MLEAGVFQQEDERRTQNDERRTMKGETARSVWPSRSRCLRAVLRELSRGRLEQLDAIAERVGRKGASSEAGERIGGDDLEARRGALLH